LRAHACCLLHVDLVMAAPGHELHHDDDMIETLTDEVTLSLPPVTPLRSASHSATGSTLESVHEREALPAASVRSIKSTKSFALGRTASFASPASTHLPVDIVASTPDTTDVIKIVRGGEGSGRDSDAILRPSASLHRVLVAPNKKSLYVRVSEGLLYLTFAAVIVISALMMWYLIAKQSELNVLAWGVGGIFMAFTLPLAIHEIHLHCKYYVSPLQRHYVRIIAMPIIYSFESWLAIRYHDQGIYLETLRDLYEAYVLWSFYHLMLQFLGGKKRLAERLRAKPKERARHLPPLCCLRGWKLGSRFVHRCTVGIYQYVILRSFTSILMVIFQSVDLYDEGDWSPTKFYLYASLIINLSQCYALYCLGLFYLECREYLKPLKPLGKFAVVKAVVFFTWWQSIGIAGLTSFDILHPMLGYTSEELAKGLQNFLICIEMFIAALAHRRYYNVKDFYIPGSNEATPLVAMQRAEADFVKQQERKSAAARKRSTSGHTSAATEAVPHVVEPVTAETIDDSTVAPVPSGFATAFKEVLPGDIIAETGEHFRTGFGLLHKWEKRKMQAKEEEEQYRQWAESGVGSRRRPASRFAETSPEKTGNSPPKPSPTAETTMNAIQEEDGTAQ
jgi:hypothetical protein